MTELLLMINKVYGKDYDKYFNYKTSLINSKLDQPYSPYNKSLWFPVVSHPHPWHALTDTEVCLA